MQTKSNTVLTYPLLLGFLASLFSEILIIVFTEQSQIGIVIALVPVLISLVFSKFRIKLDMFLFLFLLWDALCVVHFLITGGTYFFRVIIFQNIVYIYILASESVVILKNDFNKMRIICMITVIIAIILGFLLHNDNVNFTYLIFALSYFVFISFDNKLLVAIVMAIVMLALRSRSSIIMMLAVFVLWKIIKKVKKKKTYAAIYVVMIVVINFIPDIYLRICNSSRALSINSIIRQVTGKTLLSGRERIWPVIINSINSSLTNRLFGLGGNFLDQSYGNDLGVSSHNLFLFLRGQGGWLLVIIFCLMIYHIYMSLFEYLKDDSIAVGSAFIIAMLVRASFDLLLLANRFVDSMVMWFVVCAIIAYKNGLERTKKC